MKSGFSILRQIILLSVFLVSLFNANARTTASGFEPWNMAYPDFDSDVRPVQALSNGMLCPVQAKTLVPPIITLTVIPLAGMAQLSWVTSDPVLPGTYQVERQAASSGLWVTIKQVAYTASLVYTDTISFPYCTSTNFSYRVRFVSVSTVDNATSNIPADVFLWDQTPPANVQNIMVSMTSGTAASGYFPEISWNLLTGDDISKYQIDRFNGFSWDSITSVPADSNRYYDTSVPDGCDTSYQYVIFSIDKCGHRSAADFGLFVQTLHLSMPPAIDGCERLAKLTWNSYKLMPGGLGGYKIYRKDNYGAPVVVTDIKDTTLNVYSYADAFQFVNGHYYTYYVQAYSASGSVLSYSCWPTRKYTGPDLPDSIYITNVTVESDSYIRVSYHVSPDSTVTKLLLERSGDGGTLFQAIDSITGFTGYVLPDNSIIDSTAEVHSQNYFYRLISIDACGNKKQSVNVSQSIYLQCSAAANQNTIGWNSYASWLRGVEGYKVFRTVDDLPVTGDIQGSLTPLTLLYTDPLTGVDATRKVCYWVTAGENPGNPYMLNAISLSNTCCIIKEPLVFMPNAFHPGGANNRFRPVASFIDPQSFKMTIFNRWGQQIFETTDLVNGWDGFFNGALANTGLYAYLLTYKSVGGKDYSKRGTVMLVK